MWSFEKDETWQKFNVCAIELWRTQDLSSKAWRDINTLLPSDWSAHVSERDRYKARKMVVHAAAALKEHTGFQPHYAVYI